MRNYAVSHMEVFASMGGVEIVAAFDVDGARAESLARRFAIPRVCASLEEICAIDALDAIDVVTTETEHYKPVLAAIGAGRHVLVENPWPLTCASAPA